MAKSPRKNDGFLNQTTTSYSYSNPNPDQEPPPAFNHFQHSLSSIARNMSEQKTTTVTSRYVDKQTQTDDIISEVRGVIQDEQRIKANRQNSKYRQTLDTINEPDCPDVDSEPDTAALSSRQSDNQPETLDAMDDTRDIDAQTDKQPESLNAMDDTRDIDVQTEQGNTGDDKSSG